MAAGGSAVTWSAPRWGEWGLRNGYIANKQVHDVTYILEMDISQTSSCYILESTSTWSWDQTCKQRMAIFRIAKVILKDFHWWKIFADNQTPKINPASSIVCVKITLNSCQHCLHVLILQSAWSWDEDVRRGCVWLCCYATCLQGWQWGIQWCWVRCSAVPGPPTTHWRGRKDGTF